MRDVREAAEVTARSNKLNASLFWSYAGTAVKSAGQFGLSLILARLLGPEPYGLLTVAMLPIGIGALIADAGLGSGLVQKETVDPALIRGCMWWQTLIAVCICVFVGILAWPLSLLLNAPKAFPLMVVVCLLFPINALGQIPASLLRREMRFKELQIALVVSTIVGNGFIGLSLAWLGAGPWALVGATLGQNLVNTIMVWWYANPPYSWRRQPWPRSLAKFGASVIGLNVACWTITNVETIAISRPMGPIYLGIYNRLGIISSSLVGLLISPLQAVSFSHHSRNQHDRAAIFKSWKLMLAVSGSVFGCIAIPLLVCPRLVLSISLGSKWHDYAPALYPMAITMVLNGLMCVCGPILQAIGRPDREFYCQAVTALLAVPALLFAGYTREFDVFLWAVTGVAAFRCSLILLTTYKSLA